MTQAYSAGCMSGDDLLDHRGTCTAMFVTSFPCHNSWKRNLSSCSDKKDKMWFTYRMGFYLALNNHEIFGEKKMEGTEKYCLK